LAIDYFCLAAVPSCSAFSADFLKLFLTDGIVSTIVRETNRYAVQDKNATALKPRSRMHDWKEMDPVR